MTTYRISAGDFSPLLEDPALPFSTILLQWEVVHCACVDSTCQYPNTNTSCTLDLVICLHAIWYNVNV